MSHASASSIRIVGVLVLVWIGFYWANAPGAEPGRWESLPESDRMPPPVRPDADLLPHERAVRPPPVSTIGDGPTGQITNAGESVAADGGDEADLPEPIPAMRFYVVREGDTLGAIAQREYGSIRYADLVFQSNRDQLNSPHELDLGMRLRLPALP